MANFTLEQTCPLPPGAAGTGLSTGHIIYFAHPGVPYRFHSAAVGGTPPFTWSIAGQPSGMTINSTTGEVTWTNPTDGTHSNITVQVADQDGSTDSGTFDLACSTGGFRFISPTGNDASTGNIDNPWQTIAKLQGNTQNVIAYFRDGTHTLAGSSVTTGGEPEDDRCVFSQSAGRCTRWRAYPGETVVIDFESDHSTNSTTGRKPALRMSGDYNTIDGFTLRDGFNKFLWMDRGSGRGLYVTNNRFSSLGPGLAGSNAAGVMFTHQTQTQNDIIAGNQVTAIGLTNSEISFIKMYDTMKSYVAFNTGSSGLHSVEVVAYKDSCGQYMNYRNDINTTNVAIGGNNHHTLTGGTYGETWYSRYKGDAYALEFNQDGQAHQMYWDRCTLEGRIHGRSIVSTCGPFVFRNCVGANSDGSGSPWPFIHDDPNSTAASTQVTIPGSTSPTGTQNLLGSTTAVQLDADGKLTTGLRDLYLGLMGHEIGAAAASVKHRHRAFRFRTV